MKNNLFLLLKTNLLNAFKIRGTSKKKKILIGIGALYIIGALLLSVGLYEKQIFDSFKQVNLLSYFLIIVFSLASIFSFLFTIFSAKSGLFENKDNDLLFSLPLKKSTILLSRLLYLVLYNFVIGLIFILPGLFFYIKDTNPNFMFYIIVFFLVLLFAVLPTILACIFGYLTAYCTAKAKRKNIFEMLFYVIFIGCYFILYSNATKIIGLLTTNVVLMNNVLKYGFLPIFLMGNALNTGNILYLVLYIILNFGIIYLFIKLLNKSYYKIISKLNSHSSSSKFIMKKTEVKSIKKTLRAKELKRYFSSPIYVFNTGFGVLLLIVVAIISIFSDLNVLVTKILPNANTTPTILVFSLLLFMICMTDTTSSAISIDGHSFWISKVLPISAKDILKSKRFVNIIILIPVCIFSIIVFTLIGFIPFKDAITLGIFSILFGYFIANFGLLVNLLLPNLNAPSDTAVVKQSASVFVSTVIPALLSMMLIGLITVVDINVSSLLNVALIASLILFIGTTILLNTWGVKKFNKLS